MYSIRRLALVVTLVLLGALGVKAQGLANVSGNLKSLTGLNVTQQNTYVTFQLYNFGSSIPRVIPTNVIVAQQSPPFQPDGSGNISGTIQENNTITPANTFYRVCVYFQGTVFQCDNYLINANFNLNNAIPLMSVPPPVNPLYGTTLTSICQPTTPPVPDTGNDVLYCLERDNNYYYEDSTGRVVGPLSSGGGGGGGGSIDIAANQVAYATGSNAIGGSNDFTYTAGQLTIEDSAPVLTPLGTIAMAGAGMGTSYNGGASLLETIQSNDGEYAQTFAMPTGLGNSGTVRATFLGVQLVDSSAIGGERANVSYFRNGANQSQINFGVGLGPFPTGETDGLNFLNNGGIQLIADNPDSSLTGFQIVPSSGIQVTTDGGAAFELASRYNPSDVPLQFDGLSSGSAQIGAASIAGTPNRMNLPIVTGGAGQFLQTNGANPQQMQWSNAMPVLNNVIIVDGTTYTTIQAALNAVTTPGKKVFIPSGTYTLSSGLTWPTYPINLECADKGSTILNFTIASGDAITPWYGSRIAHCDIKGPLSGTALGINGGAQQWVTLTAYTSNTNNMMPTIANANGHVYKETVANCTSGASEPTWPTTPGSTVNDGSCTWREENLAAVEIYDNIVEGFGLQLLNTGGYSYGWNIHDNIFRNGLNEALLIGQGSQKITVANNQFDNMVDNGIDLNGLKNVVTGNVLHRIGTAATGTDTFCIILYAITTTAPHVDDNTIEDNVCDGIGGPAYYMAGQSSTTLSRNHFIGNHAISPSSSGSNGDGFTMDGNAGATTMDQNEFTGNTVLSAQRACLLIDEHSGPTAIITNTRIVGNSCSGSTSEDLYIYNALQTIVSSNAFLSATPYNITDAAASTMYILNSPFATTPDSPGAFTSLTANGALFDAHAVTKAFPVTTGTVAALPATCTFTAGVEMQMYLATNATPGQNWYYCTATNTWTNQLNSSSSATAFSAITSATNSTAAMVIGTGASLTTSGSGTNTATAVPFSGVTAATNANALVIGTGGSLTVSGSGTNYATSLLGNTWASPAAIGTGTPTTGTFTALTDTAATGSTQCAQFNSSGTLSGTGTTCGGGSVSGQSQYSLPIGTTSTTLTTEIAAPTANGIYSINYDITGNAAAPPVATLIGLAPRGVTGATDTILYSDNNGVVEYTGTSAVAVTLPTPTSLGNANFFSMITNYTTKNVTITPTTWTISLNGATGGSTGVVIPAQQCKLFIDAVTSTQWDLECGSQGTGSFGGGCSAAGSTASGGICDTESANTGWTPTSGQDYMRADSTLHAFVCSINGGTEPGCTFGAPTTVNNSALATTPSDAYEAFNNTATTSGATQQDCPSYAWKGHVWNSTSSADNNARWIAYCTVTNGASPYTIFTIASSVDTGTASYTGRLTLDSFSDLGVSNADFNSVLINGTKFTASGCSNGTLVGGATAGSLLTGANGPCTLTVTFGASQAASNDVNCYMQDRTTVAGNPIPQSVGATTATAVFLVPSGMVSGDKLSFSCVKF